MPIITVKDLWKSYRRGKVQALKGISFEVEEGEIYGIIGPDGAGKTTLFRLLTTLLTADRGTVLVDNLNVEKDYAAIRRRIGYMPGRFSLYQDLTVEENLQFFATVFHTTIAENYHLVADIYSQIEKFKDRKAGKLSGGMKQKLALSCALIHAPRVLFLDEPTTGVDPVSRKEFWEMLHKLKAEHGISIVVSTPYMDEAMQCDRIALIQDGAFLQIDSPQGIISRFAGKLIEVASNRMHALLGDLRAFRGTNTAFSFGETYHVTCNEEFSTEELQGFLEKRGHEAITIRPALPTIEDCFMALMRHNNE